MAKISFDCAYCGKMTETEKGAFNRAKKKGLNVYCGRKCSGLGRRDTRTIEEKKEAKRIYDIEYREKNFETRKMQKAEYFKKTYDPVKAAIERKKKMPRHVEYCRRPEYKKWKKQYDHEHRCRTKYGEFWEAASLVIQINEEVHSRMDKVELARAKGTLNKRNQRRRDYDRFNSNKS